MNGDRPESDAELVPLAPGRTPRRWQAEAMRSIRAYLPKHRAILVSAATGCHAKGQLIMRYDGTAIPVEDVAVGDLLMGPDSAPRRVESLHRGQDAMFQITPVKGEPFTVNGDHILSLIDTREESDANLRDVTVREWSKWHAYAKHLHKLVRTGVEYPAREHGPIPAYYLGMLIGDGTLSTGTVMVTKPDPEIRQACEELATMFGLRVSLTFSGGNTPTYRMVKITRHGRALRNPLTTALASLGLRCVGEKRRIPPSYLYAGRDERMAMLAGLLDTDGSLTCGGYDWLAKSRDLASDVVTLARGLGLAAYLTSKTIYTQYGGGEYWRVSISGDCSTLPMRIPRKIASERKQIKSVLRTGFSVTPVGVDDYYGFAVDGDHRYLLGDFTITHNSGKGDLLASLIVKAARRGKRCLFLVHRDELIDDVMARALAIEPALYAGKVKGTQNEINRHAVFASVQSLRGKRLETVGRFDFYFTDEAHHGGAAGYRKLYARIEEVNPRAKHIGFTATPFRNAGQGKTKGIGDVFEVLAYEYSLQDAINDGALCPIRCLRIETELDLSGVDPDDEDRVAKMVDTPERNAVCVQKYLEHGRTASGLAPAIAFCANVQHAINLAELLRESGVRAEAVWDSYLPAGQPAAPEPDEPYERGMTIQPVLTPAGWKDSRPKRKAVKCPDRAGRIAAYQRGDLDVICNATLLTEGFDAPATRIVMLLRPTQSRGMFAQMVGRATRLSPGKSEGLILDFVANSESHDLASMADLTRPTKGVRIEVGATVRHRRLAELSEGVVTAIWSAEPIVIAPVEDPDLAPREPEEADPELDYARVLWRAAPEAFERGEDSPDQAEGHTHRCRELVILRPPRTITELDIEPRVIGVSEFTVTLFGDPDAPDAARVGWYNYTTSKKEHVLITRGDGMSVLLQHAPVPKGSTAAPEWEAWLRFEGPTQHDIDRPPESLERIAVGEFHAVRTAASAKIRNPIDWKAGWLRDAASDRQIDALAKFGMNKGSITRGEASMLLELRIMRMLIQKATRPWLPRHDRRIHEHAEQPARSAPTDGTEP